MAWERNFEKRVLQIREKELKFQKLNYIIEVRSSFPRIEGRNETNASFRKGTLERDLVGDPSFFTALPNLGNRNASPMVVTIVAFFHFAVIRNQTLTPSVAFTSVSPLSFAYLRNALNG